MNRKDLEKIKNKIIPFSKGSQAMNMLIDVLKHVAISEKPLSEYESE
jgi:hypothetical protein